MLLAACLPFGNNVARAVRALCWLAVSVEALRPPNATCHATHMPIGPLRVCEPNVQPVSLCAEHETIAPSARLCFGLQFGSTSATARLRLVLAPPQPTLGERPPSQTALLAARRALRFGVFGARAGRVDAGTASCSVASVQFEAFACALRTAATAATQ